MTSLTPEQLLTDLVPFADLGSEPPSVARADKTVSYSLVRNGESLRIHMNVASEKLELQTTSGIRRFTSFRALFASELFADLRKWADTQHAVLTRATANEKLIPIYGMLTGEVSPYDVQRMDDYLIKNEVSALQGARVLLIDGPAGIGKTKFIQQLALLRAQEFKSQGHPLLLHVQSRGRNLSFIQDLMAFSLQSLRVNVTYDQVPILVRHRLVSLAIDGFDELGDPNGYDLAWAQVNDLVEQVRGGSTLVLAGRETFIGPDRLFTDVRTLKKGEDFVYSLSLQPPEPHTARQWLAEHGWHEHDLDEYEEFFEHGSYALRPFFLSKLADPDLANSVRKERGGFALGFLVAQMVDRESDKFGDVVDAILDKPTRMNFLRRFLREVARDMAENQTDTIDEVTLSWLVEVALANSVAPEVLGLIRNRAGVIAFLTNDERAGYRRFSHSQFFNYFLSEEVIATTSQQEIPKFVRRSIFGPDFLSVFGEVLSSTSVVPASQARTFVIEADSIRQTYIGSDRTARNLGSLLLASLRLGDLIENTELSGLSVDDAVVRGTAGETRLIGSSINQLDVRGADIQRLSVHDTAITTLVADSATRTGPNFPLPAQVQLESPTNTQLIYDEGQIRGLMATNWGADRNEIGQIDQLLNRLGSNGLFRLLERACRFGAYWIRDRDDEYAEKMTNDTRWSELVELLRQHDLVRIDHRRNASGSQSTWYHVKRPKDILDRKLTDSKIRSLFEAIDKAGT